MAQPEPMAAPEPAAAPTPPTPDSRLITGMSVDSSAKAAAEEGATMMSRIGASEDSGSGSGSGSG